MNKIKPWILAARPKTLFAALAPIIIGLSISFSIFEEINYIVRYDNNPPDFLENNIDHYITSGFNIKIIR